MRKSGIVGVLGLGGFILWGCLPGPHATEDGPGIAGVYVVNGIDPAGIEYSGTVEIRATEAADEYDVQWLVTGTIQEGRATLDGDGLVVDWRTVTSPRGTSSGHAEYVIGADGALTGTRTIDGVAEVGTEEIFPEP